MSEWFLYKSVSDDSDTFTAVRRGNGEHDQYANMITVIEKSAYDQLKAERDELEAKAIALTKALDWLVIDVQDYETWQRPCAAVTNAQETLQTHGVKETGE